MSETVGLVPQLRHLPATEAAAIEYAGNIRRLSERIATRWYADRFVLIAAVPKSASTVIGDVVKAAARGTLPSVRKYGKYMAVNADTDLRPEMLLDFPDGGILKYHPEPKPKNFLLLETLGCRTIVLLRHPADQLASLACHLVRRRGKPDPDAAYHQIGKKDFGSQTLVPLDIASPAWNDPSLMVRELISNGYLIRNLFWMSDWVRFRPSRTIVLRYEEFQADYDSFADAICRFLNGEAADEKLAQDVREIATRFAASRAADEQFYPHGYTGRVGTWRDYFSPAAISAYNTVIEKWLAITVSNDPLPIFYPNIRIG